MFVQDEAIFKSYDGAKKFWKQTGKQKIRKKGEGVGIMTCAIVSEQLGFLSISHEQLADMNALRARANKGPLKYYTEHDGRIYPSLHLFEHGKDREGFWGGDDMRDHTDELIDILDEMRAIFDSLMIASDDNTLEASKEAEYDTCGTEFSELIARLQIIAEDDTF